MMEKKSLLVLLIIDPTVQSRWIVSAWGVEKGEAEFKAIFFNSETILSWGSVASGRK